MRRVVNFIAALSIMLILLGLLYKRMHWPGGVIMLQSGLASLVLLFIPAYVYMKIRNSR